MKKPIYNKLKTLSEENFYPFHMPGHKRNSDILKDFYKFIDLDFTELDETDNMHKPEFIIKNSKEILANVFGAKYSYFLVNGSSCGIMASLMTCLNPNDKVLVARNCHISVYNGILLSGAKPVYIYPTVKYNITCGIGLEDIKAVVNNQNDIKAVVLTSPTYEGFVPDVASISSFLHKKGIPLIIDEAHGAHFKFSNEFPKSALENGADISIQSFHKTLPSFTQCAVLHLNSNLIDRHRLEKCLSIVQTTSPSYMFMMSIEYAVDFCSNNRDKFKKYTSSLKNIRDKLSNCKNLKLLDKDILENANIVDFDISRFTFVINSNVNGECINQKFKENKIQLEMYGNNHIIAISTICDTEESLTHFKNVVLKIDNELEYKEISTNIANDYISKIPKILPRDAFYMESQLLNINLCENKICGDFITPYPPGLPLLSPGEIITKEAISKIENCLKNNINILGVQDNKIFVIKNGGL